MMELLLGMLLGAMAATDTGRSIGNQIGNKAIDSLKKVAGQSGGKEEHHEID